MSVLKCHCDTLEIHPLQLFKRGAEIFLDVILKCEEYVIFKACGLWVKKYRNTTVVSYLLEVELLGYGVWMFNFTKWYQIVFWSGCTSLYFGKQFCQFIYFDRQCVRIIVDLYSLQHLLLLDFLIFINQMGMKWCALWF